VHDVPVSCRPRIANAELYAIGSPQQRTIFTEEICLQFVVEKVIKPLETELIRAQTYPDLRIAKLRGKIVEIRLSKRLGSRKRHIYMNAKKFNWYNFHGD
jgi:hypothetical protein